MKPVVLVVDDDVAVCSLLQDVLNEHVFCGDRLSHRAGGVALH